MEKVKSFKFKDTELAIRKPTLEELKEAQRIQTRAFHDALNSGAVLRAKLDEILTKQGLWDEAKENRLKTLQAEISQLEVKLLKGGIKLSDAEAIAFEIIDKRDEIKRIFAVKLIYDAKTAEAISEDTRTDYLLSVCVVYDNKESTPYFKDLADYLNQQETPLAGEAYKQYLYLLNNTEENPETNSTEYKFLRKYGKVDSKLRLINKQGKLVDRNGKLINEDGRYISETGEFVDVNGNPVDENGDYKFDEQPFLDDDGKPIVVEAA